MTLTFLASTFFAISRPSLAPVRPHAYLVLAALGLQLAIGICMVLTTFPLCLHTAGAALLLMAILALTAKLHVMRAVRAG